MLDYKSIVRLKKLGLNNAAIANSLGCKWDSVQMIVSRCENVWGSVDGVPDDLTNEEIADVLFSSRKSVDLDYLQPDCEKILEKQRKGYGITSMPRITEAITHFIAHIPRYPMSQATQVFAANIHFSLLCFLLT